jgi:hypothetical protein
MQNADLRVESLNHGTPSGGAWRGMGGVLGCSMLDVECSQIHRPRNFRLVQVINPVTIDETRPG